MTNSSVDRRVPTIHDVAAAAGVSSQTVHRYVNGFEGMRERTKDKVRDAIDELQWRPNPVARALRTSTGNRIVLFVHELSETGPSNILLAATKRARQFGYVLEVVPLDANDAEASESVLSTVDQNYVAGVLAFAPTSQLAELFDRYHFSAPILQEVNGDGLEGAHAQVEQEPGTIEAVTHLRDLGHHRLFLINGPTGWFSSQKRRLAAIRTAQTLGMQIAGEAEGDWSALSGYRAAANGINGATAVVAANDEMALGALSALSASGLHVPSDVSIVGFDGIELGAYSLPALTTVQVDFRASGQLAIERLLRVLKVVDGPLPPPVPNALIIRGSTGPVRDPH